MHLVQSILLLVAPAEPAAGHYTREDLDVVIRVGFHEFDRMKDRCVSATDDPDAAKVDADAEQAFVRMAELVQLVVFNYPYGSNQVDQAQHSDDIRQAAQGYERAYNCRPGWEQRQHLDRAIALLEGRIREIRDVERRPETSEDWVILQADLERIRRSRSALESRRPAPCSPATRCPTGTAEQPRGAAAPRRGYRGRWMDQLSLRVEFAGGFKTTFDDAAVAGAAPTPQSGVVLFGVAPGVRFLAGGKQRHVIGVGLRWGLLSLRGQRIQQFTMRFEYGIRVHPRWFSIHAAFEPGLQAKASETTFGRFQLGGSGALCTWNEAFCARIGGYAAFAGDGYVEGGHVGAGFDIFRVVDNLLRRSEEP